MTELNAPELYINRELSLLEFNWRVLQLAKDEKNPLLERLRYLCISSTNLDEFFEVRVAGLKHQAELGIASTGPDNLSPQEALNAIRTRTLELVAEQYRVLNEVLIPLLDKENIRFIRRGEWNRAQSRWLHKFFKESLLPV